jgi:hypothetical protein
MGDPIQPVPPVPPVGAQPSASVPVLAQNVQANRPVCHCAYCRIRSLFGPIMIITVGVVFLVAQYSRYSFGELWPFLLIVAGILKVAEAVAPREGHPVS